jgi:hypothetical protein
MDDENPLDWHTEEFEQARAEIQAGVNRYAKELARQHEEADDPIVIAWAVAFESTSIQLEQRDQARRDSIVPTEQSISASLGLGTWLANRW